MTASVATVTDAESMLAVAVEDLPLGTRHQACCKRANLKDGTQILIASAADLQSLEGLLGKDGVQDVRRAAATAQAPSCLSLLDLCRQEGIVAEAETVDAVEEVATDNNDANCERSTTDGVQGEAHTDEAADDADVYCSTATTPIGDQALDDLIGGGLHAGHLSEIVGQSASGKTQMTLQASIYAALALDALPTDEDAEAIVQLPFDNEQDTVTALRGIGIKDAKTRVNVAFLTPEGQGEAQRMTRRLLEICDALITERWYMATDVEHAIGSQRTRDMSQQSRLRRGRFAQDERPRYGLEETLQIARRQLLSNVHFALHGDYESLEHALTYFVPGLAASLARQGKSRIGLIVVDDLPTVVNEELEASTSNRLQSAVARSRLVCDLADRLKRAAVLCGRAASPSKYAPSIPAAVLVVNHVVDASDREKELLAPIISDLLDGNLRIGDEVQSNTIHDEAPLSAVLQELHFSGVLAHINPSTVISTSQAWQYRRARDDERKHTHNDSTYGNRLVPTREEIVAGILSDIRVAALGYAWVNGINARLVLTRTSKTVSVPQRILWPREKRKKRRAPDDEADEDLRDDDTNHIDMRTLEAAKRTRRALHIGVRRAVVVLNPAAPTAQGFDNGAAVDYVILPAGVKALSSLPPVVSKSARTAGEQGLEDISTDSALIASSMTMPASTVGSTAHEDAADADDYGGDADLWNSIDELIPLDDADLSQALAQHEPSTDSDLVSLTGL